MWFIVVVSSFLLAHALGQDFAVECPEPDGFFADAVQCDLYYECVDNVLTEKLCPDGLVFVDQDSRLEKCDYIGHVDCAERTELQPAQPTDFCPRQHGYFAHPDSTVCDEFYFCNAGKANPLTCPDGLMFSKSTNNCGWPDIAARTGCVSKETSGFVCPKVSADEANAHPRYPDPTDCQYFYVCISGVNPRRNGCPFGQVFNSEITSCSPPNLVPECAEYYAEYFEEYFNTLSNTQGLARGDIIAAALNTGFEIPNLPKKVQSGAGGPISTRRRTTRPRDSTAAAPAPAAPARTPARTPARAPARTDSIAEVAPTRAAPQPVPDRPPHRLQGRRPSRPSLSAPKPAPPTTPAPPPPPPSPSSPQQADADYADYYYDQADPAAYDYPAEAAPVPTTPPTKPPRRTISIGRRVPNRGT